MILDIVTYCDSLALANILKIVKQILFIIQIFGPILSIVSLIYHFLRLMSSPSDKKLYKKIINSLLSLIILFLVPFMVTLTMRFLDDSFSFSSCWNYGIINTSDGEFYYIEDTTSPKKNFIVDPGEYDTPSITAEPSNDFLTSAGSATDFLSSLERMSQKVVQDRKQGRKWLYSNSNTRNTFSLADKSTKSTNCALLAVWGYVDIGIIDPGDRFYKAYQNGRNYISYRSSTEQKLKKKVNIIDAHNIKAKTLIRKGQLLPGDIVLWYNVQHTNIYAGNYYWYDAGRQGGVNGSGSSDHFLFKTLGPVKLSYWENQKVWKIMRIKS